jgi:hypothetical protein
MGLSVLQEARQVVPKTLESSTTEERGDWGVMQEKDPHRLEALPQTSKLLAAR